MITPRLWQYLYDYFFPRSAQGWRLQGWSLLGFCTIVVWSALCTPVSAHWADLAVAEMTLGERDAHVNLTIPTGLIAPAVSSKDGRITAPEVRHHQSELLAILGKHIQLADGGDVKGVLTIMPSLAAPLPTDVTGNSGPHTTLQLVYTWPQGIHNLSIHYDLFLPGISTARCLATILDKGQTFTFVFTPEREDFRLGNQTTWQTFGSFLVLGIEHIITGYDHVLFLISLLMLGGGMSYLLQVVTAFTVAHSITLSLAVLNIVTLPSRVVESAIALTIIYVAAENFWRKSLKGRWMLTFCFGLIHGMGFASVLKEMNLPRTNLAISLVSFNLGVEVGQIIIVSIAYMILRFVRQQQWEPTMRRWVSGGVIAVAFVWFVQRAFLTA